MNNIVLDSDRLLPAIDPLQLVEAIRSGHEQGCIPAERCVLESAGELDETRNFIALTAWHHSKALGSKLTTFFPCNEKLNREENIHSVFVLFDGRDGTLRCIIVGDSFTRYKTAADSALGASILSRNDAEVLTVIGAGSQAGTHIRLLCAIRPSISRVYIWNRTMEKANRLAGHLSLSGDVHIDATKNLESAVREADIISCVTSATTPVLRGSWLKAGAHVDLVGSFNASMRESDDEVVRRGRIFVDNPVLAMASGDICIPLSSGIISNDCIQGDLYDLCVKRDIARKTDEEITVFKNAGGGHIDLMMADTIYQYWHGS